jgi:hypothetical protein
MLKYIGGGFLRGVPARDLKDFEVEKFGYSYLVRSGLYVPEKQEPVEEPDIVEVKPARKRNKRHFDETGE